MRINQPLYDRERVEIDTISLYFFQKPLGGTSPGATLKDRSKAPVKNFATQLDTNMDQASAIADPRVFMITGMSLVPTLGDSADDVDQYIKHSWARLFIGRCDYLVLPAQFLYRHSDDFKITEPVYTFDKPVKLDPYPNQFRVEINSIEPSLFGGFDLYCILHGYFDTSLYDKKSSSVSID